jgi:hypothetical protein
MTLDRRSRRPRPAAPLPVPPAPAPVLPARPVPAVLGAGTDSHGPMDPPNKALPAPGLTQP